MRVRVEMVAVTISEAVIPAKAGIQKGSNGLDPGFRRGDKRERTSDAVTADTHTCP